MHFAIKIDEIFHTALKETFAINILNIQYVIITIASIKKTFSN